MRDVIGIEILFKLVVIDRQSEPNNCSDQIIVSEQVNCATGPIERSLVVMCDCWDGYCQPSNGNETIRH